MKRSGSGMVLAAALLVSATGLMGQATSQPAATPSSFPSLAELQKFYTDKIQDARRSIEASRLASLEALLKKAPAAEKPPVILAMIEAASVLDRHDQIISLSDEYLKDSPTGQDSWAVRQVRFMALIAKGRIDQAKADWEKLSAKVDMEVWQQVFDSGILIADALLETGRVNEVKDLYKTLRTKFSFVSNLGQVLDPREASLKWVGKTPPALDGQDLTGKPLDLSQYKGKVVLIDFWATWCQPCMMALPELIETYKTYHVAGFEIIGISLDQDKQALERLLKAQQIPWQIAFDGKAWMGPNPRKFEVTAIPATFLLDRDGKIVLVGTPNKGFAPVIKRLVAPPSEKKP
jgi:thiol-disulfide isomerase/thioredoxin